MRALQAQINPHFLYNSLSIINWKAIEAGEDEISYVTLALSTYYRTSLNRGETMTTVAKEIDNIRAYLKIQLVMHDNEFRVVEQISDGLNDYMIPKLILQPLAENALYHGIKNKRGKGKILIEGFDLGEDMMLRVTDNGQGMTPERLKEVQDAICTGERAGFGLAAVSERIALYYGAGYGLRISSIEGEGTVIEVYLAKQIKEK